jgi:hypothetical protein
LVGHEELGLSVEKETQDSKLPEENHLTSRDQYHEVRASEYHPNFDDLLQQPSHVPSSQEELSSSKALFDEESQDFSGEHHVGEQTEDVPNNFLWWGLSALAGLVFALQWGYSNRELLVKHYPSLHPTFKQICVWTGCALPLPRLTENIQTEYTKLDPIPGYPNYIQLTVNVKNHGAEAQDYPLMDLTLKDLQDQVIVRKLIKPQEYLPQDALQIKAFHSHATHNIVLRMDTGDKSVAGFVVRWVY